MADRGKGEAVRRDHIYRLYSMSKPVTAAAAMVLFERTAGSGGAGFQISSGIFRTAGGGERKAGACGQRGHGKGFAGHDLRTDV